MPASALYHNPLYSRCTLVVSGLPLWSSLEDTLSILSHHGPLLNCSLQHDRGTVMVRYAHTQQALQAQAAITSLYPQYNERSHPLSSVALTAQLTDDSVWFAPQQSFTHADISHTYPLVGSQHAAFTTPTPTRPPPTLTGQLSFTPTSVAHPLFPPTSSPPSHRHPFPTYSYSAAPLYQNDTFISHPPVPLAYPAPFSSLEATDSHLGAAPVSHSFRSPAAAAASPSYSSSSSLSWSTSPALFRVWWEVIGSESQQQQLYYMDVGGWTQFVSAVLAQLGVTEIKVYHSFTARSKVRVDSEIEFITAVMSRLQLSVWVCQPGRPSPPLYVDTSSASVAEHRHVPPVMAPIPMASLTQSPSTARVLSSTGSSSTTPSSSVKSNNRKSPSSASPSSASSSPRSSHSAAMRRKVKERDEKCVFTGVKTKPGECHNCHILAASPLERRIDGEWWQQHRERLKEEEKFDGRLDAYVVSMEQYVAERARLGFQKPESGPTHVIALTLDRQESREEQYAVRLGLYAHQQFHALLGRGQVKLKIVEKQQHMDGGDLLDFEVHWSITTQLWGLYFKDRGFKPTDSDGEEVDGFQDFPTHGVLRQPDSVEGQEVWPPKVVFELYAMVWYPYCRWRDAVAAKRKQGQSS